MSKQVFQPHGFTIRNGKYANDPFPYEKLHALCTDNEMKLYRTLSLIISQHYPNRLIICPKVKIEDIITVKKSLKDTKRDWFRRAQIKARHIDFLLCEKETLIPVLAIELNDSTHKQPKVQRRDKMIESIFEKVHMPLCFLWTHNSKDIKHILYYKLKENNYLPV